MSESPKVLNTLPRRWSFSLRSLLGIVAFLCLFLAYVIAYRELPKARKEITRLRNQVGELSIGDDQKIHVIAVETLEHRSWRWRLFLPPDTKFRWGVIFDQIPATGLAPMRERCLSDVLPNGEQLIDVKLYRGAGGLLHITVKTCNGTVNRSVGRGSEAWSGDAGFQVDVAGRHEVVKAEAQDEGGVFYTEVADVDCPVVLLRYRITRHKTFSKQRATDDLSPGMMVFLEPIKLANE